MTFKLLSVALLGAASLALAGCGGGSTPAANSAADAGNAASATTTTTTTTTTAAAGNIPSECQAYLSAMEACMTQIQAQNPAAAAQVRQQLDQARASWSQVTDQATLASACTTGMNAWNSMKGAIGCG